MANLPTRREPEDELCLVFEVTVPYSQLIWTAMKKIAEIIAVFIGGVWAYYKFFRGRTFRPRLEFSLSGTAQHEKHSLQLLASVQMKNVGLSKIEITQSGTALIILRSLPVTEEAPAIIQWQQLIVLPVFEKHAWIEPGETIKNQVLLELQLAESAVKLDLRIVANGIEWNESSIIPIGTEPKDRPTRERGDAMRDLNEQQREDVDVTKKIETDKFSKQTKEDKKETQRIEHEKKKTQKP
jgi:hypothetical protein